MNICIFKTLISSVEFLELIQFKMQTLDNKHGYNAVSFTDFDLGLAVVVAESRS